MSISPMGGFYPPAYLPVKQPQPFLQISVPQNSASQVPIAEIAKPPASPPGKVSVGRFAKVGAAYGSGSYLLGTTLFHIFKPDALKAYAAAKEMNLFSVYASKVATGAAVLAIQGAILSWIYNKTQKKG